MTSKYAHGCPDKSANGLFKLCDQTGPISTIPKTPGLVVWQSGHIGISLDGEYAIEARGFKYGVVLTKIKIAPGKSGASCPRPSSTMLRTEPRQLSRRL